MSKKITIQEIQDFIKEYDTLNECTLISNEYINRNTLLDLHCSCGESYKKDWAHLQRKSFCCPKCALKKRNKKLAFSVEDIKQYLIENKCNCTLLSTEYVNIKTPLEFRCECGKTFIRTFDNIKKGSYRCEECYRKSFIKYAYDSEEGYGKTLAMAVRSTATKSWRDELIKKSNYICDISKKYSTQLEVHHLNENFIDILYKAIQELNYPYYKYVNQYSEEQYYNILKKVREMHYCIEGVVLDKEYHTLFHSIYGKENNNLQQYLEFKEKYSD